MEKLLAYISKNWGLMKPASGPIGALAIVVMIGTSMFWRWHFNELMSENARLKSVLGVGNNPSVNVLIELTNEELKSKSMNIVKTLRGISSYHESQLIELQSKKRRREVTEIQFEELSSKEVQRALEEFRDKAQVDALMVYDELKTRVPSTAKNQLGIGGIHLNPADKRDSPISLHRLFSMSTMSISSVPLLASNIEELAKSLRTN